jgi:long-subunit acyl-CoA synthetase (AMP-forming)
MEYLPLTQRLLHALDTLPSSRAQMFRTENGWQEISSAELLRRIARLSAQLERIGVGPGDRVGVFAAISTNRPTEWLIS